LRKKIVRGRWESKCQYKMTSGQRRTLTRWGVARGETRSKRIEIGEKNTWDMVSLAPSIASAL